jgi:hypothetical protein
MASTDPSATKQDTAAGLGPNKNTAVSFGPGEANISSFVAKPFSNGFMSIKDWNAKKQEAYEKKKAKQARKQAAKKAANNKDDDDYKALELDEGLYDASVSGACRHNIVGGNA